MRLGRFCEDARLLLLPSTDALSRALFGGSQNLALATDGACEALYYKAGRLQHTAYGTLGTIRSKYPSGAHALVDASKDLFTPHLGLFLGSEGIEVYDVNAVGQGSGEQVAAALLEREVGRDGRGLLPWCGMDGSKEFSVYKSVIA